MTDKKTFIDLNPAMHFINPQTPTVQDTPTQSVQQVNPPMKRNPRYIETKSRRLNLLIQPSLYEKIKGIAQERNTSVNDAIHQMLKEYLGMPEE